MIIQIIQLLTVLTVYLDLAWSLTSNRCPGNTVSKDSKNDANNHINKLNVAVTFFM